MTPDNPAAEVTPEMRAEWRAIYRSGYPVDGPRILALLDALDAAERERDEQRFEGLRWRTTAEANGTGALLARAEAAEAALAAVRALADEWEADYPSDLAACDYAPDKWWRDLRAALGDADGGGDR